MVLYVHLHIYIYIYIRICTVVISNDWVAFQNRQILWHQDFRIILTNELLCNSYVISPWYIAHWNISSSPQVQEQAVGIQVLEYSAIYEGFGYKQSFHVPDDVDTLDKAAVMAGSYKKCADRLWDLVSKLNRTAGRDTNNKRFLYMLQSQHMFYVNIPQISPNSYLMCPSCSL